MQDGSEAEDRERSFAVIDLQDLERLSQIACDDLRRFIANDSSSRAIFAAEILCVCLCQGPARHYVDRITGVKDFDVFTFFAVGKARKFSPRRRTCHDFGASKFGRNPDDAGYTGRRVDVMGRSIAHLTGAPPVESVRAYLRTPPTRTARCLAKKAVVIIDPGELRGQIVWP